MNDSAPAGWPEISVGELFVLDSGLAPVHFRPGDLSGPFLVFGANGPIGSTDTTNFGPGYLIGRVGAAGSVTRVEGRVWASDNALTATPRPHRCEHRFAEHFLRFLNLSRLSTTTAQPLITQGNLAKLSARTPTDLTDQARIAAVLDRVDEAIGKTEQVIAKLKQVRAGLLHDLLTRGLDEHGQLRNPLAHPEQFQDSQLIQIPRDWQVCRLGGLAEFINGRSFDASEWAQHGLPIIRIQNLNGEESFNYYQGATDPRWCVAPGDLLFAWSGTRETSFGPRIWPGPAAVLNQHIFKVIEDENRVSKVFLYFLMRQNLDRIIRSAHGFKLSFVHVTRGELTEVELAVPPRDEQDRIVAVADAHDRLAITEEEHLAKLLRIKSGLMTDLLTGRVPVPADLLGETA